MNFSIPAKTKNILLGLMGIGLITTIAAFLSDTDRAWANLLLNSFWFTAIALASLFFVAVHYVAEGGWHTAFKRVPEAMAQYLPFGAAALLMMVLAGYFHLHHVWHWLDADFQASDALYQNSGKKVWLNNTFWLIRTLLYLGGWIFFLNKLIGFSRKEDLEPGLKWHKTSYKWSAGFMVFFAVTSSTSAWDWLMSIDVHWFSTLYGWYVFAGFFVSALTIMLMLTIWLRNKGFLPLVNQNHIHDLAKLVFAFSVFWTYLWFSQYMLIWYSNIPEEINYFLERFYTPYQPLVIAMLIMNFAFPLIVLMHRDAKRMPNFVFAAGFVIVLGHLLDMFQMIMPGATGRYVAFGWMELGMAAGFFGFFMFVTLNRLAKAPMLAKNHPFLNESKQHHI